MLKLKTKQGYSIYVPDGVDNSSTYVLLEKEEWFERELRFLFRWLKPGMKVLDIGANVGVYTLACAGRVGACGHVYAVEPGARPRTFLEASRRDGGLENVTVIEAAISDMDGQGFLKGEDSELATLVNDDAPSAGLEPVAVARLDTLACRFGWRNIDFVKIDVEGNEHKVLAGGRDFLSNQSPMVMFEVSQASNTDKCARHAFESLGYRIFRILGNGEYLVPVPPTSALPKHDLNLFAVRGDVLRRMEHEGFLTAAGVECDMSTAEDLTNVDEWLDQPFARSLEVSKADIESSAQKKVILNFLVSRNRLATAAIRYGALLFAWEMSRALVEKDPAPSDWLSHVRLAWELGYVDEMIDAIHCCQRLSQTVAIAGVFLPPSPRFDGIPIEEGSEDFWFSAALGELLLQGLAHSTGFCSQPFEPLLASLCANRYATSEMARGMILHQLGKGLPESIPEGLWELAASGLNPNLWKPSNWSLE